MCRRRRIGWERMRQQQTPFSCLNETMLFSFFSDASQEKSCLETITGHKLKHPPKLIQVSSSLLSSSLQSLCLPLTHSFMAVDADKDERDEQKKYINRPEFICWVKGSQAGFPLVELFFLNFLFLLCYASSLLQQTVWKNKEERNGSSFIWLKVHINLPLFLFSIRVIKRIMPPSSNVKFVKS